MKIVIDIPEEMYKEYVYVNLGRGNGKTITDNLLKAIKNGTPLPKHHGRLIDADWVKNTLDIYVINEYNGQFIRRNDIDSIPTIIEGSESE